MKEPTSTAVHSTHQTVDSCLEAVTTLYASATELIRAQFQRCSQGHWPDQRVRAVYPKLTIDVEDGSRADTRDSYGFVQGGGRFSTTLTRPDLFQKYLRDNLQRLTGNHAVRMRVEPSDTPIPLHFAFDGPVHVEGHLTPSDLGRLGEVFDLPDLSRMDDRIVNGAHVPPGQDHPLALFTAPRVDYSLQRLRHYTGTDPADFQSFVILTNYQFYIDQFRDLAREELQREGTPYTHLVTPGGRFGPGQLDQPVTRLPQMPAYHLTRANGQGVTMVNIGVGPSNARTITDHIAVLRPHAWLMLGHCAGLRTTQRLGDYVLAHGYVRDDHVLDDDLPVWVPVPPLAEVQVAIENAVADVTGLSGYELKSVMRTGTVASTDNRNWELQEAHVPIERLSRSRAIALDMESAAVAANGFRMRVPYGTLLCVSDKPLHGQLKLPAMADEFYRSQVNQHLRIGLAAIDRLRKTSLQQLHSRKLRSFNEVAFR